MVEHLKDKLNPLRRNRLVADVWDANLDGQLFLKAMGFMAKGEPIRQQASRPQFDYFDYRMEYRCRLPAEVEGNR